MLAQLSHNEIHQLLPSHHWLGLPQLTWTCKLFNGLEFDRTRQDHDVPNRPKLLLPLLQGPW